LLTQVLSSPWQKWIVCLIAARQLKLRITGVVGILVRAWQSGLVEDVPSLLEEMRRQGYWLSDELLDVAARMTAKA
jgi:predicted nucleic acid-binding protein